MEISDLRKKLKSLGRMGPERNKIKSSIEKAISSDAFKLASPCESPLASPAATMFSPSTPQQHRVHASASLPPMPPLAPTIPTLPNSVNSTCGP